MKNFKKKKKVNKWNDFWQFFFGKFLVLENTAKIVGKFSRFLRWFRKYFLYILLKFSDNFKKILKKI